jgi:hypothetical protein
MLARERQRAYTSTREERAAFVDRVRRLAVRDDMVLRIQHLGEREDRLLRPVRRHDLRVRIDVDAEPPPAPRRCRLAELRQPLGERVRRALGQRVDQSLPDHRVGRLVRIAAPEVEHLDAVRHELPPRLLEPDERIRRHLRERRVDHDRNLRSVSYARSRLSTGTCSSTRCA